MNDKILITPRKVQGFWELMPKEQILFSSFLDKIESVFKTNCFLPLDTPVLEYSDALLAKSGGETDKQVFRFCKGDNDLCMRYDLTVPLARFVAMHKNELNFPFKRYQIGKVYRGERPQKGRFREFYQCDADIIGDGALSLVADAECVNMLEKCFDGLNLEVEIHISNRKILGGYIEKIDAQNLSDDIFIILDKADKLPTEEIQSQLVELGISKQNAENLLKIAKICGIFDEIKPKLQDLCENEQFLSGISELGEVVSHLKNLGAKNVVCDISVIRGHNYYTGTVFEAFLKSEPNVAVGGGGRFDNLCGFFSDKAMPGVGMSVGVTRLFDLLLQNGHFDQTQTSEIELAIINFDETLPDALSLMGKLREMGVKADVFYENPSFKSKMKEANRRNIKFVLIVGEDEIKNQKYTLKNMQNGEQQSLNFDEVVQTIQKNRMCN